MQNSTRREDDHVDLQTREARNAAENLTRSCECAARGTLHRVFTCPICVGKVLHMFARADAQGEMFYGEELPF